MNSMRIAVPALAAALLIGGAAQAHGKLLSASPPVGGEVAASPAEIRMTFSEGIFLNFSGVVLKDAAGHAVKTGASHVESDKKVFVTPVSGRLAPGVYQVEWHVVCMDTHRMKGSYAFTVK